MQHTYDLDSSQSPSPSQRGITFRRTPHTMHGSLLPPENTTSNHMLHQRIFTCLMHIAAVLPEICSEMHILNEQPAPDRQHLLHVVERAQARIEPFLERVQRMFCAARLICNGLGDAPAFLEEMTAINVLVNGLYGKYDLLYGVMDELERIRTGS